MPPAGNHVMFRSLPLGVRQLSARALLAEAVAPSKSFSGRDADGANSRGAPCVTAVWDSSGVVAEGRSLARISSGWVMSGSAERVMMGSDAGLSAGADFAPCLASSAFFNASRSRLICAGHCSVAGLEGFWRVMKSSAGNIVLKER